MNSLPKTVTRQRRGWDLNPGPSAPESSMLTTRLPSHPVYKYTGISVSRCVKVNIACRHHTSFTLPPAACIHYRYRGISVSRCVKVGITWRRYTSRTLPPAACIHYRYTGVSVSRCVKVGIGRRRYTSRTLPPSAYTLQVYRCFCVQVCEGRYRTAALLRAHRRRHTSDASRHVCEICGRTFMYRSNLEVHSAVHTSERAFPCSTCGKSFKTASTLSAHQVSHHNHHHHRHF